MIQISINLPTKHRIDLKVIKNRKSLDYKPLIPKLGEIFSVRKGSKISRIFRNIFEHSRINKILGTNLAIIFVSASLLTANASDDPSDYQESIATPVVISTEHGTQYPVKIIKITQGYKFFHPGLDLDGITGDPVYPIEAGFVEAISNSRVGYGKAVLVNHGGDINSLYAHLSEIMVSEGQKVNNQTIIGKMGATGHASGDHLHLEIRDSGRPINPLTILPK